MNQPLHPRHAGNPLDFSFGVRSPSRVLDVDYGAYVVPVPVAAWLFGPTLLALAGLARRRG